MSWFCNSLPSLPGDYKTKDGFYFSSTLEKFLIYSSLTFSLLFVRKNNRRMESGEIALKREQYMVPSTWKLWRNIVDYIQRYEAKSNTSQVENLKRKA